jgi:hypothetical protein
METSFWSVSGRDHLDPAACINKPTVPPGGFLSTKITYAFKHNTYSQQVNAINRHYVSRIPLPEFTQESFPTVSFPVA